MHHATPYSLNMSQARFVTYTLGGLALSLGTPSVAFAQGFVQRIQGGIGTAGQQAGFAAGGPPLPVIIGNVIGALLGIVGIALLIIMIYAGFLWMTAGGNTTQVEKARKWIFNAIIGMIIVAAAFAISNFVLTSLITATTGGGGAATPPK